MFMLEKTIKGLLLFGSVYFVVDGLIHLLNIKLISVADVWPKSAVAYSILLDAIFASFIFLAAGMALVLQSDLKKYKTAILASSLWAIWHGFLLIFLSFNLGLVKLTIPWPSVHLWFPFYDQYLAFQGCLLLLYAVLVLIWFKKK